MFHVFLIDLSATFLCRSWVEDEVRETQACLFWWRWDDNENGTDNSALGVETKNHFVA